MHINRNYFIISIFFKVLSILIHFRLIGGFVISRFTLNCWGWYVSLEIRLMIWGATFINCQILIRPLFRMDRVVFLLIFKFNFIIVLILCLCFVLIKLGEIVILLKYTIQTPFTLNDTSNPKYHMTCKKESTGPCISCLPFIVILAPNIILFIIEALFSIFQKQSIVDNIEDDEPNCK